MSDLTPGTVVRVLPTGNSFEDGIVGYVARTKPDNGDDLLVGVISAPANSPFANKPGLRLSFENRHVEVLPK